MPMWNGGKMREALVINTMEFTRAKIDKDRRKGKSKKGEITVEVPEATSAADLRDSFIRAIQSGLRELDDAYKEMTNARQVRVEHVDKINQTASELQELASSSDFRNLARAAASLTRLTQFPAKSAAFPQLIKLHSDSLRSIAAKSFRDEDDETSKQLLEALKIAVDNALATSQ